MKQNDTPLVANKGQKKVAEESAKRFIEVVHNGGRGKTERNTLSQCFGKSTSYLSLAKTKIKKSVFGLGGS